MAGEVRILQIGTGRSVSLVRARNLKSIAPSNGARYWFIPKGPSLKEAALDGDRLERRDAAGGKAGSK